jgi:hypothetical protein
MLCWALLLHQRQRRPCQVDGVAEKAGAPKRRIAVYVVRWASSRERHLAIQGMAQISCLATVVVDSAKSSTGV